MRGVLGSFSCWLLVAGCWLLVAGCWFLVTGSDFGFRISCFEFRVEQSKREKYIYSLHHQHQPLQVFAFGVKDAYGMVGWLGKALQNSYLFSGG